MSDHQHGPSYPGQVVLELGEGTGALIVHTGQDGLGREIEIEALTPGGVRTHAEVRERRLARGNLYCAVYSAVPAGDYLVGAERTVTIRAGQVTEIRWPDHAARRAVRP
jgi:hypothetical protein